MPQPQIIGSFNYNTATQPKTFLPQSASFNAIPNASYFITGNSVTVTLPPTPADNTFVTVCNGTASITGCVVARYSTATNAYTIMGSASDLTIDTAYFSVTLVYRAATKDWILV